MIFKAAIWQTRGVPRQIITCEKHLTLKEANRTQYWPDTTSMSSALGVWEVKSVPFFSQRILLQLSKCTCLVLLWFIFVWFCKRKRSETTSPRWLFYKQLLTLTNCSYLATINIYIVFPFGTLWRVNGARSIMFIDTTLSKHWFQMTNPYFKLHNSRQMIYYHSPIQAECKSWSACAILVIIILMSVP